MKAHKYCSLGALACMAGCFYTGSQETDAGSQVFCLRSIRVRMGMAIYSGHKMIAPKKKKS
ncbi:DUF6219 family protein [Blautia wexlerae]|nr:DUF6219 family protein [Blautia wexlerae]